MYKRQVVTAFLPILLAGYWNDGAESVVSTFRLGWANASASLVVALLAPVLGAIADGKGGRKRMLAMFALLGVTMTSALFWVAEGQWLVAAVLYAFAYIGFAGGNSFYDSLLSNVADESEFDRVSAYGFALGYLGGALLFTVNVLMVMNPGWFELAGSDEAMRLSLIHI